MKPLAKRLRELHAELVASDGGECEATALYREAAEALDIAMVDLAIARARITVAEAALPPAGMVVVPREQLAAIHSALDDAGGDSDVTHIEDDAELRAEEPVQWAAMKLALLIWKDDEHGT
jgi:hypothetical protein